MKNYKGFPPADGTIVAECDDWVLYSLPLKSPGFAKFKLIARQPAPKANFHLQMDARGDRIPTKFCSCSGVKVLEEHAPDVLAWATQAAADCVVFTV